MQQSLLQKCIFRDYIGQMDHNKPMRVFPPNVKTNESCSKGPSNKSKTPEQHISYNFIIDIAPTLVEEPPIVKERQLYLDIYTGACKRLGVIPVSQICKDVMSSALKLRSYNLGPKGTKAMAIMMVVSGENLKTKITVFSQICQPF